VEASRWSAMGLGAVLYGRDGLGDLDDLRTEAGTEDATEVQDDDGALKSQVEPVHQA
jgi:hypothetical protein